MPEEFVLGLLTKPAVDSTMESSFSIKMQNMTVATNLSKTATANGEDGKQEIQAALSKTKTITFDGKVTAACTVESGDVITYGGHRYLVKSSTLTSKNDEFQTFSISADNTDDGKILAYGGTASLAGAVETSGSGT
jgi:hypothetical protein